MKGFLRRLRFVVSNEAAAGNEGGGFWLRVPGDQLDESGGALRSWGFVIKSPQDLEGLGPRGVKFPFPELLAGGTRRRKEERSREKGSEFNTHPAGELGWLLPVSYPRLLV